MGANQHHKRYNIHMKLKTVFLCQKCEFQTSKWVGKCPSCESWNSFVEDVINVGKAAKISSVVRPRTREKPKKISEIPKTKERCKTNIEEFDQVLGGGIVEGSLILLSGEPGIGKSTLTLQIVDRIAKQKEKVIYISGEESVEQISSRAKRLGVTQENIEILYETNLENIIETINKEKPEFLVLDSIQVIASQEISGVAGSLSQVRYVTEAIMNTIKTLGIPTLLIGHVTKDGNIAGPKLLEHLVDTVLIIEGERDHELRMLRALKNRFGSISEIGIFEMQEKGLIELKNPGQKLIESRPENSIGSCLTITMEGNRPLVIEVQALVSHTHFGYPKRAASGFDKNRLELLIAVMQKHSKIKLHEHDVYINIVGGLRLRDPAADLAICLAISSSFAKKPLPKNTCAYGEVGLTGEIRPVRREKERDKTAKKLGLNKCLLNQIKNLTN
jgi:DNA repair protein RadA/Sms